MQYRREYDMKWIGCNLRSLRKVKKLTVKEVSRYLRQASVQTIYKYEAGKCYPSVDVLLALMQLYEADLYDILCGTGSRPVPEPRYMTKPQQIRQLKGCLNIYRSYLLKKQEP